MLKPRNLEICLKGILFHAYIGVSEHERKIGNDFEVNLTARMAYLDIMDTDDIQTTISYADLYQIVSDVMKRPHKLLEKVAAEIITQISSLYPDIEGGEIEIIKIAPPIPGIVGKASVKLFF